jgi:hypothetical protein
LGGRKFFAQHWRREPFDVAFFLQLVDESIAAEYSVDRLAELVAALFGVEAQVMVPVKFVIRELLRFPDTSPTEFDHVGDIQGRRSSSDPYHKGRAGKLGISALIARDRAFSSVPTGPPPSGHDLG